LLKWERSCVQRFDFRPEQIATITWAVQWPTATPEDWVHHRYADASVPLLGG